MSESKAIDPRLRREIAFARGNQASIATNGRGASSCLRATSASRPDRAIWSPRCATASVVRTRRCSSTRRAAGCSACGRRWRRTIRRAARSARSTARDHDAGLRAAWLMARLHAFDLLRFGITVDCLPVLDVPIEGASDVIGTRAYGKEPETVDGAGPRRGGGADGRRRAAGDEAHSRPRPRLCRLASRTADASIRSLDELRRHDFAPFKALADLPMAMTAHVVYNAIDPKNPATTSGKVIDEIIRGEIGFDGLLMSDDTSMKALSGDFPDKAAAILAAGCDIVLHCNGVMRGNARHRLADDRACGQVAGARGAGADLYQQAGRGRRKPRSAANSPPISTRWPEGEPGKRGGNSRQQSRARPTPMDRLWAENDDSRLTGEPSLVVDVDGFEGPLDLLSASGPQPEGRSGAHLDPRAGRAVSALRREGAGAAAGARRRLSGDGGVAGLSSSRSC